MSVGNVGEFSPNVVVAPGAGARIRRRWLLSGRRAVGAAVLVLQHREDAPAGGLLDALNARGWEPVTVRVDRGERLPDPGSVKLAVVLGSNQSLHDVGHIRLPARAQLLAHDRLGPQAFRANRHLGVQFHPEVTPQIVRDWVAREGEALDSQGILEATSRDFTSSLTCARRLFSGFLSSVGDRAAAVSAR